MKCSSVHKAKVKTVRNSQFTSQKERTAEYALILNFVKTILAILDVDINCV